MPRTATTTGLTMWQFALWSSCTVEQHATAFTDVRLRSMELSRLFNDPFKTRFALVHLREKRLDRNGFDDETSGNAKSSAVVSSTETTVATDETTIVASNNSTRITASEDTVSATSSQAKSTPEPPALEPLRIRLPLGLKYAFDTVYAIWGYAITILGVGLTLGLVLNLLGYAYQFEPDGSFRIDTIEHVRTETQFRLEIENSMRQASNEERSVP
jgi:hypothetical protein